MAVFCVGTEFCASLQTPEKIVQALGKTSDEAVKRAWDMLESFIQMR
jgi:hypothetical protein